MQVGDLVRFRVGDLPVKMRQCYLVVKIHFKDRVSLTEHHPSAIFMMCDLELISESKKGTNEKKDN